jgi:autotransporter-associated beta strand protein
MKANPFAVRAARGPRISAVIVRGSLLFLAVTGLLLAFEGTACAQPNRTWTGLGADSQWTTAENWDPVGVPHPNLGDTQYTMAGTTRLDPTISQIYVIHKITYDNTAGAFTITNSSALWMGSGGFLNNSASTQTVNAMVNLFASQTWNAAAGDMVFTDVEMLFGSAKLLTVDGAHDVTVTGNFSGQAGVTKQGAGTLLFSGTNTYTNGTTVEAGTLRAGSATALPQNTNYTVDGGTLDLNDFDLTATQLNGTGGTIDLGSAELTVDQTTDTTFAGVITGTGILMKSGAGNLTLTGANDYSGGTDVMGGTLTGTTTSLQGVILNDADVVFDQTTNGTYAGAMSGIGAVTKEGSGTVSFTGANTYTGTTTVNAGTLAVNGSITSDTTVGANGTLAGSARSLAT